MLGKLCSRDCFSPTGRQKGRDSPVPEEDEAEGRKGSQLCTEKQDRPKTWW